MLMFLKGNAHHLASLDLAQEAKMAETAEITEKDKKSDLKGYPYRTFTVDCGQIIFSYFYSCWH